MPIDPGVILLGGMLVLLVLMFRRGGKQRQELAAVQANLAPGAEVMTSSGLYATVVAVDGDVVTLATGPGATSRWDRRAVVKVLPGGAPDTPERGTPGAEPATDTEINERIDHPDDTNPAGPA